MKLYNYRYLIGFIAVDIKYKYTYVKVYDYTTQNTHIFIIIENTKAHYEYLS